MAIVVPIVVLLIVIFTVVIVVILLIIKVSRRTGKTLRGNFVSSWIL